MVHFGPFSYGPLSMQNLAIANHNGNHYRVNFAFISKKDAFNLIKNAMIIDKK